MPELIDSASSLGLISEWGTAARRFMKFVNLQKSPFGLKLPLTKDQGGKPVISPEQFSNLVEYVSEPYASMLFMSAWTGLRIPELIGLRWRCIHADSITVGERYCRGDWSTPKKSASAAMIGVAPEVIARIHLQIGPDDLVFQSIKDGKPMSDQNVLKRHVQPMAPSLGLNFVDWRCLLRSYATWLVQLGADPKSVQGQMQHARVSTTMDIYAQAVPLSQRRVAEKLSEFTSSKLVPLNEASK